MAGTVCLHPQNHCSWQTMRLCAVSCGPPSMRRLAYSNCGFYVVHEAHDLVAALVEGLLAAISGIPAGQQQTCSR